jgi:hypothetical protein
MENGYKDGVSGLMIPILFICGCIPSLHSLYIDSEDLVFD